MPYFAEGDLVSHLAPRAGEGSTARLGRVLRLFRDVLETLAWIHQHGIAHRDIKPTNVLVSTEACACGESGEHSHPIPKRVHHVLGLFSPIVLTRPPLTSPALPW